MKQELNDDGQFYYQRDRIRGRLLKYTRKAFRMLPKIDKPYILDIGCGSGIPTLELARISQGVIKGIDIDQAALDRFQKNIEEGGIKGRVRVLNRSMINTGFTDESFDIIWSEGSIYVIGFKRGLREWKRFLKPGGFMVIHDEQGNINQKLKEISICGYDLLGYFLLSEHIWRAEYFAPLEKLLNEFRMKCTGNPEVLEGIAQAQVEIDMFKDDPCRNISAYFVIKKKSLA